ncbi:MAG TPA: YceI family protein [Candidatus Polarisedimenticolaceae bacterium]|nr:YceI family protein [Candidatus Polarisedimenticolaceae bacterium]
MRSLPALSAAALAMALTAPGSRLGATPAPLKIDAEHSTIGFSVRHLYTRVQGMFRTFEGKITFDESSPAASTVQATIRAASIDTNVAARDKHLKSDSFFDTDTFPTITFVSSSVSATSEKTLRIAGALTMHGVTKPVTLDAQFVGKGKDPWGNVRYGFHATTTVNREDFGMHWNEALETGGILVGNEIEITLEIEAIQQP